MVINVHLIFSMESQMLLQRNQRTGRCMGDLGEMRSLVGPYVPVVALTATASLEIRKMIMKDLCMDDKSFVIDPNKTNI